MLDSRRYESGQNAGGRLDGEWTVTATKVDKTPVGDSEPVGEGFYPDSSRSLESLRHIRLMALLRDMIEAEDGTKAAARLGVSYRTVSRAIDSGRLTARMSAALERHLLLGGGSAAAQQRREIAELTKRVASLEEELRGVREAVEDRNGVESDQREGALRRFERRLARLEAAGSAEAEPETAAVSGDRPVAEPFRRIHRELVTEGAEPGEERVYGEATPAVVEWRAAKAAYGQAMATGSALQKADARIRLLELEIELIEGHELTLPPATHPWDGFDRRDETWLRRQSLGRAQSARTRARTAQAAPPGGQLRTVGEIGPLWTLPHRSYVRATFEPTQRK